MSCPGWLKNLVFYSSVILGLFYILVLNSVIPFFSLFPSSHILWLTGFGESFFQGPDAFSLYASNFGYPVPMPLFSGLPLALPTGFFIYCGMHPADAYSLSAFLWILCAFLGCWRLMAFYGKPRLIRLLFAVGWLSTPIVFRHSGLSHFGIAFALFPVYVYAFLRLSVTGRNKTHAFFSWLNLSFWCSISLFMDPYSYIMFFSTCVILLAIGFLTQKPARTELLRKTLPMVALAFCVSMLLYLFYNDFNLFGPAESIDIFRALGADVRDMFVPPHAATWWSDRLGLSGTRRGITHFGDGTNWYAPYMLPSLLCGLTGFVILWRSSRACFFSVLGITIFAFWMSLGPSLNVNARHDDINTPTVSNLRMPPEFSVMPTGNEYLSKYVPGFKSMRFSYRWCLLTMFGLWLAAGLGLGKLYGKNRLCSFIVVAWMVCCISLDAPRLKHLYRVGLGGYANIKKMDSELLIPLSQYLSPGAIVGFLPASNDWVVNYIAPRLKIITPNVGGDKNVALVVRKRMSIFDHNVFWHQNVDIPAAKKLAADINEALISGNVDRVVIPFFRLMYYFENHSLDGKERFEPLFDALRHYNLDIAFEDKFAVIKPATERRDRDQSVPEMGAATEN